MTMTSAPPDEAEAAAQARCDFIVALFDLAAYLETHPEAPLPTGKLNIPVRGATHGEKTADLAAIAGAYGVPVIPQDGTLIAERRYGPLTVEAHLTAPDLSARIAARQDTARQIGAVA